MEQLFQSLSKTNDGAFIIDHHHRIIFWNTAAEKLLGFTAQEVLGRQCYEILGGRDEQGRTLCQRFCTVAIQASRGGILPNQDLFARSQTGKGRWLNVTAFVYPANDKTMGQVIVHLFRDASEKKNYQRFVNHVLAASQHLQQDAGNQIFSSSQTESQLNGLTTREWQVMELLAMGRDTEEIAKRLVISPATVRNHVQHILEKWGVHSRLEAIAYAYQLGLVKTNKM